MEEITYLTDAAGDYISDCCGGGILWGRCLKCCDPCEPATCDTCDGRGVVEVGECQVAGCPDCADHRFHQTARRLGFTVTVTR
jgi:hypothetical protein